MGLFGDLDASEIADNPWEIKPATYEATVTEAMFKRDHVAKKNEDMDDPPSRDYFVITHDLFDEDGDALTTLQKWLYKPANDDDSKYAPKDRSRVKEYLLGLGVSEADMNNLDEDEIAASLVGIDHYVTTRNRNDRPEVASVKPKGGEASD